MKFEQHVHGEFVMDEDFEFFVKGWMAYHKAADEVDGHLPLGHPDQSRLGPIAVRAGWNAMHNVLGFAGSNPFVGSSGQKTELSEKWQRAKREALRRLGF